jgi:AraC-like DNA-binding protein
MRLAARWLAHSDKPIAEIAFDLGYQDASNFTRAFRRQIGASPQAFRDNVES